MKVLPSELPFEGIGDLFEVAFEVLEAPFDLFEVVEVVGGEHLALDDGEVDLDLVEPAGVNWGVDDMCVGPLPPEAVDAGLPAVDGGVVQDPEDAPGAVVGGSGHHVADEAVEVDDAGAWRAGAEDLGAAHVPRGDVGERAAPFVLVFDAKGPVRRGRTRGMDASARLNARLLVGAEDKVPVAEGLSLPAPLVEVEYGRGLLGEARIPRKHPAAVRPRLDGVLVQPAPDGGAADVGDDSAPDGLAADVGAAKARQRQAGLVGKLAGERFDGDHDIRGGTSGGVPAAVRRRGLRHRVRGSASATC